MSDWEPWVEYPHLWKTKSAFYAWLRGCLRGGLWNKSPIKLSFKNSVVSAPPAGYSGRAKSGAECALSGVWTSKSFLEVDHKLGNVSLNDESDIIRFIKHLVPAKDSMQLVSKEAHKIKSYAERYNMSYDDAVIVKNVIEIMKKHSIKYQLNMLTNAGYDIKLVKNAKQRRQLLTKMLKENQNAKEDKEAVN